jgi:hypothetical protein
MIGAEGGPRVCVAFLPRAPAAKNDLAGARVTPHAARRRYPKLTVQSRC